MNLGTVVEHLQQRRSIGFKQMGQLLVVIFFAARTQTISNLLSGHPRFVRR